MFVISEEGTEFDVSIEMGPTFPMSMAGQCYGVRSARGGRGSEHTCTAAQGVRRPPSPLTAAPPPRMLICIGRAEDRLS